jgi:hypothetical protein
MPPLSLPTGCVRLTFVVSEREAFPPGEELPNPARKDLDEPHLTAEDLEREIGDSEAWDEASEDTGSSPPADK